MPISRPVSLLLSNKRLRKRVQRKKRRVRLLWKAVCQRALRNERFGESSEIIRKLSLSFREPVAGAGSSLYIKLPRTFSIIDDPVSAIRALQSFAKCIRSGRTRSIFFDQAQIAKYDLAAMALLDVVASEVVMQAKRRRQKMSFAGSYPAKAEIRRCVRSIGIVKHLNVKHEVAKGEELAKIRLFDRRNRHYYAKQDPTKADFKSRTVAGFVDHINICLRDNGRVLTPESRAKLCDYIGEVLGNAEDHPGFVDWTVQGYLDNDLDPPVCEIAIFNFGKSIAQTLQELPKDHYTYKQISPYIVLHHGQGLFSQGWRQVDLLTLVALQGHVSSKNYTRADTRGQGMGDLIDFFQRVHDECVHKQGTGAKMAILSGGTHILFDGTYRMRDDGRRGRLIAFNKQNSLYAKPDARFVRPLGDLHFPGTVISIRFPLSVASSLTIRED